MTFGFIGRRRELDACRDWLIRSGAAQGRLVSLAGEAGIGKTRLMEEFARLAMQRGHAVAWSQMIEDPGAPPYLPWTLALRSSIQQLDDDALRADLGHGAGDVADILPELSDRLGLRPRQRPRDATAARFQLYDSVARFLLALARRRPLLLLFDSLHLADRSSLGMLEYYSRQVATSPTLVVISYREPEVGGQHPLRDALPRLQRTTGFTEVELQGLSRDEAAHLLSAGLGHAAAPALVDCLTARSDGNPLYLCEVAAQLQHRQAMQAAATVADVSLPRGLRDVVAARLESLPPRTRDLLRVAAVLGRDFDRNLLADVAGRPAAQTGRELSAATATSLLIRPDSQHHRFRHALFREALLAELADDRRVELHQAVALALEQRLDRVHAPDPAQLAYHFFEAARLGYDAKAVTYCRQAAEDALARRAHGEAVVQYERALQVVDLNIVADPALRTELLLALGQAEYAAGQLRSAAGSFLKAAVLAHRHRWWDRLAEAILQHQHACAGLGLGHLASVPLHRAAIERLSETHQGLRARLLGSLAIACRLSGDSAGAERAFMRAVDMARRTGDDAVLHFCLSTAFWALTEPDQAQARAAMMIEACDIAEKLGNDEGILYSASLCSLCLLPVGDVAGLRRLVGPFRERAAASRNPHFQNVAANLETALAILEGRWSDAVHSAELNLQQASLQDTIGLEGQYGFQMFEIERARGRLGAVAPLLKHFLESDPSRRLWLPGRILLHYELGQVDAARSALEQLGDLSALPRDDLYDASLAYLAQVCAGLKDRRRCRELAAALGPRRTLNICLPGTVALGAGAHYLALLAVACRRFREARTLFEEALQFNERMGAPPLTAQTRAAYAALLMSSARPADRVRARELLAGARVAAEELGMDELLGQVEQLAAAAPASEQPTEREIAILRLIAAGESNKRIAAALGISQNTVATHVRNVLRKTGSRNRTEAVAYGRRCDLIPGP